MAVKFFGMIRELKNISSHLTNGGTNKKSQQIKSANSATNVASTNDDCSSRCTSAVTTCTTTSSVASGSNAANIAGQHGEQQLLTNSICSQHHGHGSPCSSIDSGKGSASSCESTVTSVATSVATISSTHRLDADNSTGMDSDAAESTASNSESQIALVDLGPSEKLHVKPGDFEFLKVIGKGSFGKVMLAKHRTEQKTYAVKVLQKKMIIHRNEKTHIMCERNVLLKNLHHPFLVGLHYSFQTRDKLYFILDYVNGGELFFHLQKERCFSETRARFYAAEICCALGYLHSQCIVYRDLKPENILLDGDGHVILTDFGLCKDGLRQRDTTGTFCGTPEYLAPEVLRKEQYDWTVDWWCLGAVLYEMLYGLPPFYSRDLSEMCHNILNKPLKLRTNISAAARKILDGLLQKDKKKRLGATHDVDEIKKHEFFRSINWTDLEEKKIKPPFNPNVKGALDLRHIDPEFTREPVPNSLCRSASIGNSSSIPENAFLGFSYAAPNLR